MRVFSCSGRPLSLFCSRCQDFEEITFCMQSEPAWCGRCLFDGRLMILGAGGWLGTDGSGDTASSPVRRHATCRPGYGLWSFSHAARWSTLPRLIAARPRQTRCRSRRGWSVVLSYWLLFLCSLWRDTVGRCWMIPFSVFMFPAPYHTLFGESHTPAGVFGFRIPISATARAYLRCL